MNTAGISLTATQTIFKAGRHTKNHLLLLLICILAYWPVSFGIFSVKNDAIHYFLPFRFQIGEAIRNGQWPLWSPYIYNGYPISGDMQSGAWNPIVWIISFFSRYNLRAFQFECLLYIFIAGAGMYRLAFRLSNNSKASLTTAIAWMLSGFLLSGQLINWLAAAAFIPFVLHYYTRFLKTAETRDAVKTALVLYLLLVSGYPSFFVVTGYTLAVLFLLKLTGFLYKEVITKHAQLLTGHLLLIIIFTGLSLPALTAYVDLLPYYQRGGGVSVKDAAVNAYNWRYLSTMLFPSVAGHQFEHGVLTDLNFRNTYIGLIPLLALLSFRPVMNRVNLLLITGAILSFLFSLGNLIPVHQLFYRFVPLFDSFRHPAQMRLYFMLALLLLAVPGICKWLSGEAAYLKKITRTLYITAGVLSILLLFLLFQGNRKNITGFFSEANTITGFKDLLHSNDNSIFTLVNCILQLLTTATLIFIYKKRKPAFLVAVSAINVLLLAQLLLPLSFVSSYKAGPVNAYINAQPAGFPVDLTRNSLAENSARNSDRYNELSLASFYNKKPAISTISNNPSFLKQMEDLINDSTAYRNVSVHPIAYLIPDTSLTNNPRSDSFNLREMGSCFFSFNINITRKSVFYLTQNYQHNWQVTVNGVPHPVENANICFMKIALQPGIYTVNFSYKPVKIFRAVHVMLAVFGSVILFFTAGIFINLFKETGK